MPFSMPTPVRRTGRLSLVAAAAVGLAAPALLAGPGAAPAAAATKPATSATTPIGTTSVPGWKLSFSDELSSINTSRWTVKDGAANSNEQSFLTTKNVTIDNGALRIQGRKQSAGGRQYTSGYVHSRGKVSLPNYFRVEMRAKVPLEMGFWAAPMWFRPADGSGGEIDLVETYGADLKKFGEYRIHHTIHTAYGSGHTTNQKQERFPSDPTGWHTYTIEKTKGKIVEYVDGKQTALFYQGDPSWFNTYYEAGKKWSMIMNLQIGGHRGAPDSTTNWSLDKTALLIDYVRVWNQ